MTPEIQSEYTAFLGGRLEEEYDALTLSERAGVERIVNSFMKAKRTPNNDDREAMLNLFRRTVASRGNS